MGSHTPFLEGLPASPVRGFAPRLALLVAAFHDSIKPSKWTAGLGQAVGDARVGDLFIKGGRGDGWGDGSKAVEGLEQGDGLIARWDAVRALWGQEQVRAGLAGLPAHCALPWACAPGKFYSSEPAF